MRYDDTSIGAFFKSLLGKPEAKAPVDTSDEFDAEYYRGDYGTVKRAESEFEVPEEPTFVGMSDSAPVERSFEEEKSDFDDFDFVDDDIVGELSLSIDEVATEEKEDQKADEAEEAEVKFIENATLGDASAIADSVMEGAYTVVDISNTPADEKVRMFDFISGVVYACGGRMEKLQNGRTVLILPEGKEIDDFKAAMSSLNTDEDGRE